MTEVRQIARADLHEVTRVHIAAFPSSELTRTGAGVVRRYYQTQWERPSEERLFIGAWAEGRLAAFICAGFLRDALPLFVRRHRLFLVGSFLLRPWLLLGRGALARVRSAAGGGSPPADEATSSPSYRVLSIATHPSFRGRGLAGELLAAAEEAARRAGQLEMGLTVEPTNESAVSLYLNRGWERMGDRATWTGAMRKVLA